MNDKPTKVLLVIWGFAVVAGGSSLMVNHLVSMPRPDDLARVAQGLTKWTHGRGDTVVHIIPHRCSCTNLLVDHLLERGPLPGLTEHVVLSGPLPERETAASRAGFLVHRSTPAELRDHSDVRAGPLMVVLDPDGSAAWVGGYFDGPALDHPRDMRVLAALRQGVDAPALPVFGCAIDPLLRDQLDPLGLRESLGL